MDELRDTFEANPGKTMHAQECEIDVDLSEGDGPEVLCGGYKVTATN